MLRNKLMTILIAGIFLLTACGGSDADLTPTVDPNALLVTGDFGPKSLSTARASRKVESPGIPNVASEEVNSRVARTMRAESRRYGGRVNRRKARAAGKICPPAP